jgi:GT2 family glycosyltransferase
VNNDIEDSLRNSLQLVQEKCVIKYFHTAENIGFARANNIGIKHSSGAFILLLNSDTLIIDSAIDKCISLFEQSDLVACGVQLLNADGSFQHSGTHFNFKNAGVVLKWPYLKMIYNKIKDRDRKPYSHQILPQGNQQYVQVDWINGAFLMVKRVVLDRAGLLDEEFFLYSEETEWCYRIGKDCGKLGLFREPEVIHYQGVSAAEAFRTSVTGYDDVFTSLGKQMIVSEFLRTKKQFGIFWMLLIYTISIAMLPLIWFIALFDNIFKGKRATYTVSQIFTFSGILFSCGKYCMRMLHGKPYFYKVI